MRDSEYHPTFPFLKRFQTIKYSFVAIKIPLSNNIGETYECVIFKINGHEKIYRNLSLSQNSINLL